MERNSSSNGAHDAFEGRASAPIGRFQCSECSQTFGRVEHLTRHSRSHTKELFLKCSYCRKGFYRSDALRRHEQVHKEPRRSGLGKGARACLACAAARRKCSGGNLCTGCQRRSIDCKYPEMGKHKSMSHPSPAKQGTTPSDDNNSTHSGGERRSSNCNHSPMSWSNASASPSIDQSPDQMLSGISGISGINANVQTQPRRNQESSSTLYPNPYLQNTESLQNQLSPSVPGFVMSNGQTLQSPNSRSRPQASGTVHDIAAVHQLLQAATHLHSLGVNNGTASQSAPEENSSMPWYDNSSSSINWLPGDWTPDFPDVGNGLGAFEQVFGQDALTSPSGVQNIPDTAMMSQNLVPTTQGRRDSVLPTQVLDGHDMSSPSSQSTRSAGRYYVDGDGARLPRVRKPPYRYVDSYKNSAIPRMNEGLPTFKFPEFEEYREEFKPSPSNVEIPDDIYGEILRMFNVTCVTSTHFQNFQGGLFPSSQALGHFVHLYKENFQLILPFIHPSTFNVSKSHWLFILALATIGSQYQSSDGAQIATIALHEYLRRAIQAVELMGGNSKPSIVLFTQIKLLNCVGMMYCGNEHLAEAAKSYHSELVFFCNSEWVKPSKEIPQNAINDEQVVVLWKAWREAETKRRTGYCVWLLDCMWAFHFDIRPMLTLDDAKIPIPCQEVLWEAETALDWHQLYACSDPSPSLHSSIQLAYIEKRLQSSMGEFSRILCIHALFRRTWEVENYFKQPLTLWTPTAEKQSIKSIERSMPVWLPGIQTYAKWRNSACDCLDILHWHANSVIGAASGMEHPTVLHLHLARVILLTPFHEIVKLAKLMTSETPAPVDELAKIKKYIKRWVEEDQYKARLAMIHAGVLFWHVRRYSADAFYEPSSVFLATLALWAYGTFASRTSPSPLNPNKPLNESPIENGQEVNINDDDDADAESLFPTFIQLDRPADDELVQLFVKRGNGMRAMITGVGNLCSTKGPVRVLVEGRGLLEGLKVWGVARGLWDVVKDLIEVLRGEGGGSGVGGKST